jgi:hypothetical protein
MSPCSQLSIVSSDPISPHFSRLWFEYGFGSESIYVAARRRQTSRSSRDAQQGYARHGDFARGRVESQPQFLLPQRQLQIIHPYAHRADRKFRQIQSNCRYEGRHEPRRFHGHGSRRRKVEDCQILTPHEVKQPTAILWRFGPSGCKNEGPAQIDYELNHSARCCGRKLPLRQSQ